MGITLSQIAANTATVAATIAGETVTITYFPNKITDQLVAQIGASAINDNQMFMDLIKSWDIYEDDAQTTMLPIERVGELGIPIKVAIAEAIVGDMSPKATPPVA
jgi:hypothetical protein